MRREALLIGQFEFAANSAAQLSLDENEDGKQGDSWICADHANSTSKKVIFREMVAVYEKNEEICPKISK